MTFSTNARMISTSIVAMSLALLGCQDKSKESNLKITNGLEIAEDAYPSVVKIQAIGGTEGCTATFINDQQLLTAAHCLDGMDATNPELVFLKPDEKGTLVESGKALSFVLHPDYDPLANMSSSDLAIVNFPEGSAPGFSPFKSTFAAIGSRLILVGYGDNATFKDEEGFISGSGAGVKRIGRNTLGSYTNKMIRIEGLPAPVEGVDEATRSCSGQGDSGGPLFVDKEIAGINFGGGLIVAGESFLCVSYYVNPLLPSNKAFIESQLIK